MDKFLPVLRKCALFEGIELDGMLHMLRCLGGSIHFFDKKYTVFAEGNPAKQIGIVLSGSVQMIRMDYYGNRSLLMEAGPGELFGEAFACAELTAIPVTVQANEPSEVMLLDSGRLLHTCSNNCAFHQRLIFNLMKDLATKTIHFHQKIEISSKRTTREKLMTYLMLQAQKAGDSSFEIPFDRQELADYLEVDRSGLSSEIGKLRREGVLENHRNHFRLL